MDQMTRRIVAMDLVTREAGEGEEKKMIAEGRAILYGVDTVLYRGTYFEDIENIQAGASTESLAVDDQRAVWNHDLSIVLGRKSAGTLSLVEDAQGVSVEIDFPNSEEGRSKYESIRRGDVKEMSFGFNILKSSEVIEDDAERDFRTYRTTIEKLKLWEVSPVTFAQYEDTEIQARAKRHADEMATVIRSADWKSEHVTRESELRKIEMEGLYA